MWENKFLKFHFLKNNKQIYDKHMINIYIYMYIYSGRNMKQLFDGV